MAENTGLEVEIGVTLERLTKQLAQAEARMIRAAKKSEDAFEKSNGRAAASFRKIDVAAERTEGLMGRIGGGIAGAFAGGLAVGVITQGFDALRQAVAGTLQELGDLADTSDRISIDTETLQGLQRGFGLAGVEVADLNKGLEQFSRRIGDAAQGGAFAKVLDRFNIELRDAQGNLRPNIDLLKEFADVIRALPEPQQLAVAQEAFGRGGIALVNGLREGGAGLDQFVQDARDAGSVIDDELVRKAEEIGDRFDALSLRLKVFFQTQIVRAAELVGALGEVGDTVDAINVGGVGVDQIVSPEAVGGVEALVEAAASAEPQLLAAQAAASALAQQAQSMVTPLLEMAANLRNIGETQAADAMQQAADKMQTLVTRFNDGQISAEDFAVELGKVRRQAIDAGEGVEGINEIGFASVIAGLGSLGNALTSVYNLATLAAGAVRAAASASGSGGTTVPIDPRIGALEDLARRDKVNREFIAEQTRINSLTAEQIALEREVADVREKSIEQGAALSEQQIKDLAVANLAADAARRAANAGKGGGGGGARKVEIDERAKVLELGLKQIEQLEFEASLLGKTSEEVVALTAAHQMLNAAKQAGLNLDERSAVTGMTLREEIDAQAASIGRLTVAYDVAQQKAEFFDDITGQLKDGLIDAIVEGENFAGVLADVAKQIAKAALQAALFGEGPLSGLFGGAGSGLIGGLFKGFASGGYTGAGGKYEPKGIVHGGEFVFSKDAVRRIGVKNLEAMHNQLKGFAGGGYVGASPAPAPAAAPKVDVVILDDNSRFGEYLSQDPGAERAILQVINRNGIGRAG